MFEATRSWLVPLSRRQAVVLVLDDLQWASKPVLLMLMHLLRGAMAEQRGPTYSSSARIAPASWTRRIRSRSCSATCSDSRSSPAANHRALVVGGRGFRRPSSRPGAG